MSTLRQTVLETLGQQGPLSVAAMARAARVSTMVMRYHLTLLAREGLIVQQDVVHRGEVGRPQILYALADPAHAHLPKKFDTLAACLLDEITGTLGAKEARAMLRRAGRRAANGAPPSRQGAGVEARVKRTARFLSARGYMARWEKSNDDLSLIVCNCPYREVAQKHNEVCEMDHAMIGALLDVQPKMTRCIARQDGQCQFTLAKKSLSNKR
jgi:predicted ArsR family transcriptional regulator